MKSWRLFCCVSEEAGTYRGRAAGAEITPVAPSRSADFGPIPP